jgi:hypothetical protein
VNEVEDTPIAIIPFYENITNIQNVLTRLIEFNITLNPGFEAEIDFH